jgi:hypothetical protein
MVTAPLAELSIRYTSVVYVNSPALLTVLNIRCPVREVVNIIY